MEDDCYDSLSTNARKNNILIEKPKRIIADEPECE